MNVSLIGSVSDVYVVTPKSGGNPYQYVTFTEMSGSVVKFVTDTDFSSLRGYDQNGLPKQFRLDANLVGRLVNGFTSLKIVGNPSVKQVQVTLTEHKDKG